jgi:hypothetical protein
MMDAHLRSMLALPERRIRHCLPVSDGTVAAPAGLGNLQPFGRLAAAGCAVHTLVIFEL